MSQVKELLGQVNAEVIIGQLQAQVGSLSVKAATAESQLDTMARYAIALEQKVAEQEAKLKECKCQEPAEDAVAEEK